MTRRRYGVDGYGHETTQLRSFPEWYAYHCLRMVQIRIGPRDTSDSPFHGQ
jgi:hypothetical protein